MENLRSIVSYKTEEYGRVKVKLAEVLENRGITRNHLSKLTGIKYEIVDRYYKARNVAMADLDFLAKVCFALNCQISDLLEYEEPDNSSSGANV